MITSAIVFGITMTRTSIFALILSMLSMIAIVVKFAWQAKKEETNPQAFTCMMYLFYLPLFAQFICVCTALGLNASRTELSFEIDNMQDSQVYSNIYHRGTCDVVKYNGKRFL